MEICGASLFFWEEQRNPVVLLTSHLADEMIGKKRASSKKCLLFRQREQRVGAERFTGESKAQEIMGMLEEKVMA